MSELPEQSESCTSNGAKFLTRICSIADGDTADMNTASKQRVVVTRFFLDRPGYDLHNSSARLWRDAPETCKASDIAAFLVDQGMMTTAQQDDDGFAVEVYLDKFHSYMLLEVCQAERIEFDFSSTSTQDPGVLNIRLTDKSIEGTGTTTSSQASTAPHQCNTSPVGLFAFSLTVALESTHLLGELVPNSVSPSFALTWGPYAFFVSGLLQLIVGMYEVLRNNVYGATAFMAFGCFWLANGTKIIFSSYFPADIPDELLGPDPVGNFIRHVYIFGFACVLFKQTLVMYRLTTALITLLCCLTFVTSFAGWSIAFEWMQMIFGFMVSIFSFYTFTVEFTNEVYQREVFKMYPWHKHSSAEVFGAAGRPNTLQSKATNLRLAHAQGKTADALFSGAAPTTNST